MINYFYTVFRQAYSENTSSFLGSFILFILAGFGGILSIAFIPFGTDALNTIMFAEAVVAIIFSVHLFYPGYKISPRVLTYSIFKLNIIYYALILASVMIMGLAIYLLVIVLER